MIVLDVARWRRRCSAAMPAAVRVVSALLVGLLIAGVVLSVRTLGVRADPTPAAEVLARRHEALSALADALSQIPGPVRRGDRGPQVTLIQQALWELSGRPPAADGVFGPATEQAVRMFQEAHGLEVDGIAGRRTLAVLMEALEAARPRAHVVARGETLAAISRRYGVSIRSLAAVNGLADPDRIQVGAVLWIPDEQQEAAALVEAPASPAGSPAPAGEAAEQQPAAVERQTAAEERQSGPLAEEAAPGSESSGTGPVALTFNDGPNPDITLHLLQLLEEHGVPATFFLSGADARRHPDLVRQAASAGHEIANHGWGPETLVGLTVQESLAEIDRAQTLLAELAGSPPRLFRPQGAVWDAATLTAARRAGLDLVLWTNIGAEDLPGVEPETLIRRLREHVYPGAIVMLHADNPAAVEALRTLLPEWRKRGVRFLTLSELLVRGAVPTAF